ncbi:MAG: hypothetical protein K8F91_19875 [Candidatus Obscuribacterales bacterium]|nr:hypothetical protein [Candidatus Obscuribacterales bacterium]
MNTISELYLQAGRSSTSQKTLASLTKDACEILRARVAENESTPVRLLKILSRDASSDVRISVACNPATPANVLEALASDNNPDVRFSMAENHNLPTAILIRLAGDENPYVALRAVRTLETNDRIEKNKGELTMSASTIERTFRRMLHKNGRLNKNDARELRKMILADGYFSKSEKKLVNQAIESDLLDEPAFEIFLDLLLQIYPKQSDKRAIA